MLHVPYIGGFAKIIDSEPADPTLAQGLTALTDPTVIDTKTAWQELIAAANFTADAYGIRVIVNMQAGSGAGRPFLMDVGIDPAGGTSYSVLIANLMGQGGGTGTARLQFYFPLFIKAGASLAMRCQWGSAAVAPPNTLGRISLFAQPRYPDAMRCGSYVETIGVDEASTSGVAYTPGTATDGAWADLGATTVPAWYWQVGHILDSNSINTCSYLDDFALGDGTNFDILIKGHRHYGNSSESAAQFSTPEFHECVRQAPAGIHGYYRGRGNSAVGTGHQACFYAMGG